MGTSPTHSGKMEGIGKSRHPECPQVERPRDIQDLSGGQGKAGLGLLSPVPLPPHLLLLNKMASDEALLLS